MFDDYLPFIAIQFFFFVFIFCIAPIIPFFVFKGSLWALILMIAGIVNIVILVGKISIGALRGTL